MNAALGTGFFWMSFAVNRECLLEKIAGIYGEASIKTHSQDSSIRNTTERLAQKTA